MKLRSQQNNLRRSLAGMRPASGWENDDPKPDDKPDDDPAAGDEDPKDQKSAEDVLYPDDKNPDKKPDDADPDDKGDDKDPDKKDPDAKDDDKSDDKKDDDAEVAPDKPEDYEIGFPEELGLTDEEGELITLADDDPLVSDIRAAFHEDGLTQTQANRYLGIYGAAIKDMGEAAKTMATEAENRELAVLHKDRDEALTRIEKVATSARNILGDADGDALKASLHTGQAVIALEKLLAKVGDEGSGTPPSGGDEGNKTAEHIFYGGQGK